MNRGNLPSLCALALCPAVMVGCAAGPDASGEADGDGPVRVTASHAPEAAPATMHLSRDDYDAVFNAAIRELRDAGFRIARNDRRFGVITTWPKESPTAFEPWVGDNTTGDLARRSTLNHLRRAVEVTLTPAGRADGEAGAGYTLTVAVTLEREQRPNRYLNHSAGGTIAARYDAVPAHLAHQGIPASYWEPAGNDPHLAKRLLGVIRERSGSTLTPQYDDEDIIQADDN